MVELILHVVLMCYFIVGNGQFSSSNHRQETCCTVQSSRCFKHVSGDGDKSWLVEGEKEQSTGCTSSSSFPRTAEGDDLWSEGGGELWLL